MITTIDCKKRIDLQELEKEQIMTGISVLSANLVETKRATATMMTSAPKTIFVETTTASSSGNRQIQKLIVASQVDLQSVSHSISCQLLVTNQ